jgi:dolichol kinase
VAVGTAAGAIIGQVIGRDTRSTIAGALTGAAAGTAIAMGTADVDAVLNKGSAMVVRTETPVSIVKS